jgi:hypothetical protein
MVSLTFELGGASQEQKNLEPGLEKLEPLEKLKKPQDPQK